MNSTNIYAERMSEIQLINTRVQITNQIAESRSRFAASVSEGAAYEGLDNMAEKVIWTNRPPAAGRKAPDRMCAYVRCASAPACER